MKILKHGNEFYKCKCPRCGVEFEASHRELNDSKVDIDDYNYYRCPECNGSYRKIKYIDEYINTYKDK